MVPRLRIGGSRPLSIARTPWLWLALLLFGLSAWSCEGCSEETSAQPPPGPCDTIYAGQCGTACTWDVECPDGLYCSLGGTCWADCAPEGSACPTGICNERGRCVAGQGGAGGTLIVGGGPQGGAGGGVGGACGSVDVNFAPTIPTVVLLIDQSGSMTETFDGQERWDVVYNVLMDPTNGVVAQLQEQVRFGLVLYTYSGGGQCPQLVEVMPPALGARAAIDAVYADEQPESNTPTGDSIAAITPGIVEFAEPGPKLLILATDGDPDRCEDPNGHDAVSKAEVIAAVQAAYTQGVETVIIAVGNDVSQPHQQDVANAGQGLPVPAANPCNDPTVCAPTYEPSTQQAMVDAFLAIINGQRGCVFALDGQVIAGKECQGVVMVNGEVIACADPDGWQLNGPSEIEFVGAACETIMNDPEVTIEASFPCDAVGPPA